MKRFFGTALLISVVFVGAYAADDKKPQTKEPVARDSSAIPRVDQGDIPPRSGATDDRRREVSREGAEYLQKLRKNTPFGTKDFDLAALRAGMVSRRAPKARYIKLIPVKAGEVPCEWVLAPGADPDIRLLYIHGSGFVSGSGGFYLTLAAHISAAARCAVLLPDYRLAPEHRFPAGLDDCVRAHEWMIANGPSGPAPCRATFIAGDSAGGGLTLATLLALRDRKLKLPAGGIPLSPTTDLTLASESLKTVDDPIISAKTMPIFRDHYLGKADPRNPLASPVFGDYRGLPPLLIQVGEHEMLRDDSVRVAKKARADGISVRLEVWPGMFHVFQSHEPLLPEAREAIDHIAEFMRSSLLARDVKRNIPYANPADGRQVLDVFHRSTQRTCPWSSGFTAAVGKPATRRTFRSSHRFSWSKGSDSSPLTTDSSAAWTWRPSCATWPSPSAGCTSTSPTTAAIRSDS
jgi:epsilon-lactone hydrolase